MQETPPMLPVEPPASETSAPEPPKTSLAARLLNVFAVPGEVFEEVKNSVPAVGNWLVPALIGCVVGVVAVVIALSEPKIANQIKEQQAQALEKQMNKLVEAGKLSRQQADQRKEAMEKFLGPMVMKITGSAAAVFWSFARVFGWGLVLWLLGMWLLQARFGYLKAVEIAGLAGMIGILGTLVKVLLQLNFSSLTSSPSLALAVKEFNPQNPWHMVLAGLNLFDLWEVAVLGLGLARLAGVPFARAGFAVFGFWVLMSSALITFAAVMQRVFG